MSVAEHTTLRAGPSVRVEVLRSVAEIEQIRSEWEGWPGHRDGDFTSYKSILKNPTVISPYVIVVYREDKPDAILVGRRVQSHLTLRVGYARVGVPATTLFFVYGGIRGNGSAENCQLFVGEIRRSLSTKEADLAYLNFLNRESELYGCARQFRGDLSKDSRCVSQDGRVAIHYRTTLPKSFDEFYMGLTSKQRNNHKRRIKRLAADFPDTVKIMHFSESAEMPALAEMAEQVASKSYQRGLGVGFRDSAEERENLCLNAERGSLHGYVLCVDRQPIAFWMGELKHGTFSSNHLAFDPYFSKYAPGMYLAFHVIEQLCGDGGARVIDFEIGAAEYKAELSNTVCEEVETYLFAPSLRGSLLSVLHNVTTRTDLRLKRLLDRFGLLQQVKKKWRSWLSSSK